jgi:hypothetical protein
VTSPEDPGERSSDLEKQVADARRIADLERQLSGIDNHVTYHSAEPHPVGGGINSCASLG